MKADGASLYLAYVDGDSRPVVYQCSNPGAASPTLQLLGSTGFSTTDYDVSAMRLAVDNGIPYMACEYYNTDPSHEYEVHVFQYNGGTSWVDKGMALAGGGTMPLAFWNSGLAFSIEDGALYVAYQNDTTEACVAYSFALGAWSPVGLGSADLSNTKPLAMGIAPDGTMYLACQSYTPQPSHSDVPSLYLMKKSQGGVETYPILTGSATIGGAACGVQLLTHGPYAVIGCYDYPAGTFDVYSYSGGDSVDSLGVFSGLTSYPDSTGVAMISGVPCFLYPNASRNPVARQYAPVRATAPTASAIAVANNLAGTPDTVTVSGLNAGDTVTVYSDAEGSACLGMAKVAAGQTSAALSVAQLGASAGSVYVGIIESGKWESTLTQQAYPAEPSAPVTYTIAASPSSASAGTVSGSGVYDSGDSCNLTAAPKAGYRFVNWTEGGSPVSANAVYSFTVTGGRTLVANFLKIGTPSLSIPACANYNTLKITWTAVPGAKGYYLYRSTASNGKYTKLPTVSGTSATDTNLVCGTVYYYKVMAYCVAGTVTTTGPWSNIVSGKTVLPAPTGLKAVKASATSAKLSWGAVVGAQKYEVYRCTTKTGVYKLVGTVATPSSSFTNTGLKKGTTYYYKVKAYRTVGTAKVYSKDSTIVAFKLN